MQAVGAEKAAQPRRQLRCIALDAQSAGCRVGNDVHARRGDARSRLELGAVATGKLEEDGFDVLAASQPVDAKVGARAGELARGDVANLDAIQAGKAESDFVLAPGDLVYVPPATPVGFGYGLRRALYPLEVVLQTLAGPILGFLIR